MTKPRASGGKDSRRSFVCKRLGSGVIGKSGTIPFHRNLSSDEEFNMVANGSPIDSIYTV
jgi:hypothetical protein